MDGAEVAKKLGEDAGTKDIPVIFLTCLFQKREGEEEGRVVTGKVLIAKPYSIDGLSAQIERLANWQCVHR